MIYLNLNGDRKLATTKKIGIAFDESSFKHDTGIWHPESSERLKILLDDLLDLRKIEEGKIDLDLSPQNLQKIIIKCVGEQEAVINSHNIQVFYEFDSVIPLVNCDEDRVGQIIMNVLSNAIKFSPEGGRITFKMNIIVASGKKKFIQMVCCIC